jgi:hypothetical protein
MRRETTIKIRSSTEIPIRRMPIMTVISTREIKITRIIVQDTVCMEVQARIFTRAK